MANRTISLHAQLEYELNSALIHPNALLVDDINDDNKNEIVVGTDSGDLFIYKGLHHTPWLKSSRQIGSITCICYDDVTNQKKKFLIVFDVTGNVYLFTIGQIRKRYASDFTSTKLQPTDYKLELRNIYHKKLLANPKSVIVYDFGKNGLKNLLVLSNEFKLYCFEWQNLYSSSNLSSSSGINNYTFNETGKFVLKHIWEFDDHIYSLCLANNQILVSQSEFRICKIKFFEAKPEPTTKTSSSSLKDITIKVDNQPDKGHMEEIANYSNLLLTHNYKINSYLVTNIHFQNSNRNGFLVSTNGDIAFFSFNETYSSTKLSWSKNIKIPIVHYHKVKLESDGNDFLVVANSDGVMCIIDCLSNVISIDLGEPIHSFYIGSYSLDNFASHQSFESSNSVSFDIDSIQSTIEHTTDQQHQSSNLWHHELNNQNNNKLCILFTSTLNNKLCVSPIDVLVQQLIEKRQNRLKSKCYNIKFISERYSTHEAVKSSLYGPKNQELEVDLNIR